MVRKIIWVLFLLLLVGLFFKRSGEPQLQLQGEVPIEDGKSLTRPNLYTYIRPLDLNGDGVNENLIFKAYVNLPTYEITELFINDASRPTLTLHGFYKNAFYPHC